MIKFAGTSKRGTPLIGFGLSRANCERLLAGQPIRISVDEMNPNLDIEVIIFAGETEAAIEADFRKHGLIGPGTKYHKMHPDDPHAK